MRLEILRQAATGPEQGAPLLFVHGSYCAAWVWADRFMPFFADRGHACVAPSLRGHGDSDGGVDWASLADYVDDIEQVAATLDRPPVVVGHSLGGLVAQVFVARGNPVAGLAMLASTPASGLGGSALHMATHAPDVLAQLGLLQAFGPSLVSSSVMVRALFSAATDPAAVAWMGMKLQRESARLMAELAFPVKVVPPKPAVPALVVGGSADMFLPVSAFEEEARLWRAELRVLDGAPHGLMLDSQWWRPTAAALADWLGRGMAAPVPAP